MAHDSHSLPALRGLDCDAMTGLVAGAGFDAYRGGQLYHWIFARGAAAFEDMANLPRPLRAWLAAHTRLATLELVRTNGDPDVTRKLLFRLADGRFIESVLMCDPTASDERTSLCLSTQVGCAVGCTFCLTGYGGFQRNLTADEIVGQAIVARRILAGPAQPPSTFTTLDHIVFMGMGEPLLNLDAVIPALRLLTDPKGFGLSRRRVTVSTAGVVPGIERIGKEGLDVGLAVSLNATTDAVRSSIMPINKRWPIASLLEACRRYPLNRRRRITFEYVLLKEINDTAEDARRLVGLLHGIPCKVNLIMFNPSPRLPYEPVEADQLNAFARTLSGAHLTVTVRWSKGREIDAACGQLAAHYTEATHAG
jgi:23S rRNA (adenine2503-C2)-methyltransferase